MKNIFILLVVLISTSSIVTAQSSRLSKVGYLNVEEIFSVLLEDETIKKALDKRFENETLETDEKARSGIKDMKKEVQNRMAQAILTIVRREGYTLIIERNANTILYADRNFDITTQVIALVRESILRK